MTTTKRRGAYFASLLNFLFPGLGFVYVGRLAYALAILAGVPAVVFALGRTEAIFIPGVFLGMGTALLVGWMATIVMAGVIARRSGEVESKSYQRWYVYLGYIALWEAIENPDAAADLTSVLCIVGSVFAFLSRYAVNFWNQGLHQGASLSLDKEENVADVFYLPLLVCIAGFVLLFVTLVLLRTRTEIRARRMQALIARERMA